MFERLFDEQMTESQQMATPSFTEQYIALSRTTGSVCDTIGNRINLVEIPQLLHKLSKGQFKLVCGPTRFVRGIM